MKKKTYTKDDMTLDDFKEFISKTYRGKYAGKYTLDESTWVNKEAKNFVRPTGKPKLPV